MKTLKFYAFELLLCGVLFAGALCALVIISGFVIYDRLPGMYETARDVTIVTFSEAFST